MELDCRNAVEEYMMKQNRPYSITDIVSNLHKAFGKTQITKSLDTLVAEEILKEKTISKQKIYYVNQDLFALSCDKQELQLLDNKIVEVTKSLHQEQGELKSLETRRFLLELTLSGQRPVSNLANKNEMFDSYKNCFPHSAQVEKQLNVALELKSLTGFPSTTELSEKQAELQKVCQDLKNKLSTYSNQSAVLVRPEDMQKVKTQHGELSKQAKSRKRMATDMINSIMESYPKSQKDLEEEIGIDGN